MKNPCKDCENRHTLCWNDCEEYKVWKRGKDEAKERAEHHRQKMVTIWKKG